MKKSIIAFFLSVLLMFSFGLTSCTGNGDLSSEGTGVSSSLKESSTSSDSEGSVDSSISSESSASVDSSISSESSAFVDSSISSESSASVDSSVFSESSASVDSSVFSESSDSVDSSVSSESSAFVDSSISSESSDSSDGNGGSQEVVDPLEIPDFIVSVPTGRAPVVLQITDTQIIDAAQARPGREGVDTVNWATDKMAERCYDYLTETIETVNPDFIILTGDIVYGEFDDNGTVLESFVSFMESFEIPWSPVFGNHDNESKKGVDWQCSLFESAEYCLFEQKTLTGNGNYSVGIEQGGQLQRVFYMLDSNGCESASKQSLANNHTKTEAGFGADQIEWYTSEITKIKQYSPETKFSFAFHIQLAAFADAYEKYGFDNSTTKNNPINIDYASNKADGDFGYLGRNLKTAWDSDYAVYNGLKSLGVDSIFVGHEHCNSASVVYDNIRFQYGQKSSEYDRFNCVDANGTITGVYTKTGTPLIGGSVIALSEADGSIQNPDIYLCEKAGGLIDWDRWNPNNIQITATINLGTLTWTAYPSATEYSVYYGVNEETCTTWLATFENTVLSADISRTATTVQDKLNGASEKVYYKVVAVVDGAEQSFYVVDTSWMLIDDYDDLNALRQFATADNSYTISGNFYLAHDIDCTGKEFEQIEGNLAGKLDGNGYSIKNLKLQTAQSGWATNYFLAAVYPGAYIKNLAFDCYGGVYADGSKAVRDGYIVGSNFGTIENIVVKGEGYMTVGFQLVKDNKSTGVIQNCIVDVEEWKYRFKDSEYKAERPSISAFISSNNNGTITGCFAYSHESPDFWCSGNFTFVGISGGSNAATDSQWYYYADDSFVNRYDGTNSGYTAVEGTLVANQAAFAEALANQVAAGKLSKTVYDMYLALIA